MTPAEDLASMIAELVALGAIDPMAVVSDLRPVHERLLGRLRRCAGCGIRYLQKQRHRRRRTFHSDACRYATFREVRARGRRPLTAVGY